MATGVQVWSNTPAANATSDSNINWAEGQAPSSVNDSARAVMASVAKWNNDNNGTLLTSGSTVAYTVVTNQVEGALTAGYTVAVQFHATSDVNATLAPDGLAAKPMQLVAGTNAPYGAFPGGSIQSFTYSSTGTGQWIAKNQTAFSQAPAVFFNGGLSAPAATSSVTAVMCGLGSVVTITPTQAGRCFIMFSGNMACTVQSNRPTAQISYGTGVAPANGVAVTGTQAGSPVSGNVALNSGQLPFTCMAVVTGLTLGTAYWVDLAQTTSGGTASLVNLAASIFEF